MRYTVQPGDGPPSSFASGYWFWWLILVFASFVIYEVTALATGNPQNTLSNWIWVHLRIFAGESITQWSAGDLLTFLVYISVFCVWLPWHFWLMRFT